MLDGSPAHRRASGVLSRWRCRTGGLQHYLMLQTSWATLSSCGNQRWALGDWSGPDKMSRSLENQPC